MQHVYIIAAEIKKYIGFLFAIILCQSAQAQIEKDILNNPLKVAVKVTMHFKNDSLIKGSIVQITDSTVTLDLKSYKQNDTKQSGLIEKDFYYTAKTEDIDYIKVKRKAFLTGIVAGGFIGYGLGYAGGYITHKYDDGRSSDENNNNAKARGVGTGIIGAASLAVVGSIIAPVILRKKFIVDGKRENMHKVVIVVNNSL